MSSFSTIVVIKIYHKIDGKLKLKVNLPMFTAWNIHNRTILVDWQKQNITLNDVADLAFYVATIQGHTQFTNKKSWIENILEFSAKSKKELFA
jgi:hypothetical protein